MSFNDAKKTAFAGLRGILRDTGGHYGTRRDTKGQFGFATLQKMWDFPPMPVTLSTDYDAKVDSKQRITIRGAVAKHYHITVLKDGTFVGKPMELTAQKSVTTPRSGRFMATVPNAGKAAQRASRRPAPPRSVKASFMTGAIAKTKAPAHRQHEETAPISERTMKGMAKAIANVKAGRRGKPVDLVEMAAMKF